MSTDIWRLALGLIAAAAIGAATDHIAGTLLLAAGCYIAWQLRQLSRLYRWVRDPRQPMPDSEGLFEEFCIEIDRLRRRHKRRKTKLTDYLKQFQQATTALPDAVLVISDSSEVLWANPAANKFLGIRWPQDQNQRLGNLLRTPDAVALLSENTGEIHADIPSPGNKNLQLSISVVPYGDAERLIVARDITKLHRLNQIRSDFVANVSHELKTPLTVLNGYIETMAARANEFAADWQDPIAQLNENSARMRLLIEDLLLLSRLEREETISPRRTVFVAEMLGDLYAAARELSGERHHVITIEASSELHILGIPAEIYSAFSNIVFNAVRYTPDNGIINIRWYGDESGAHFEVTDSGEGIAAHHVHRLTERFYRVDSGRARNAGGTGLGLAIVKHVLIRHGGTLHVESVLGEGATFRCDFPRERIVAEQIYIEEQA